MKVFTLLILASASASFAVGVYTDDIFNSLALYTPLSLISIGIKEGLEERELRRKYKNLMEEK
ncbi:hypothetical protein K2V67_04535 [Staphylococcus arlettae]|uniref:hypothetical protein n=1 Tax=Staphylococcus arlettae TaxID=29378 RepID=UPI001E2A830A|nr:hypothetical protein [Staphylococcus arlettae]MCD8906973.1 hypothetical protein [Staphylococcus arlettae]MEB5898335.1 hypothetical protein [Staphylococcus arlettae]